MGKKKGMPPPKPSLEYRRFKDLLRRLVTVPRKEVEKKIAEHKIQRAGRRET